MNELQKYEDDLNIKHIWRLENERVDYFKRKFTNILSEEYIKEDPYLKQIRESKARVLEAIKQLSE